ncbi:MAG: hypothetical protein EPN89_16620 [Methylovulum sp.]|nr:MAG: hypothetical protein EPN89_16620 [Methylovulum sp.]
MWGFGGSVRPNKSVKGTRRPVAVLKFGFFQGSAASFKPTEAARRNVRHAAMEMKFEQTMEEFLSPAIMRKRLISASIYIAAFESLKESIVSKIRFYYCLDDSGNSKPCESHKKEVLSRNKSAVYASLDWFKERQAINGDDLAKFEQIKLCRNDLSHELFSLIGSRGLPKHFETRFHELVELLHKIDIW